MADKTPKTIRIKWVRSGIGFTHHQKQIVRSLGLSKLNRTVVRPDTPQIRGIVAAVPHLLEIVPDTAAPAWASVPEYTVHAPVAAPPESQTSAAETIEPPAEPVSVETTTAEVNSPSVETPTPADSGAASEAGKE